MPFPVEQISANPKIPIPPDLPEILKQFTKAAIRTQPKDVLQWAAAYFRALASGERPPIKERIEFVSNDSSSWITLGLLRVLHRQLGDKEYVSAIHIQSNWDGLCLDPNKLTEVIEAGGFPNRIPWLTFLAFVCSLATPDLVSALQLFCEVVTEEPEGCPAKVPFKILSRVYRSVISRYDKVKDEDANKFLQYLADCSGFDVTTLIGGEFVLTRVINAKTGRIDLKLDSWREKVNPAVDLYIQDYSEVLFVRKSSNLWRS